MNASDPIRQAHAIKILIICEYSISLSALLAFLSALSSQAQQKIACHVTDRYLLDAYRSVTSDSDLETDQNRELLRWPIVPSTGGLSTSPLNKRTRRRLPRPQQNQS